jgi:hypothetical protein
LSIVAQALFLFYSCLCVGEDLSPPSDDVDEDYQWEIQTDEGWVPYWDSGVGRLTRDILLYDEENGLTVREKPLLLKL